MALVYLAYFICRVEFVMVNWHTVGEGLFSNSLADLLKGSLLFDTSAIIYTNLLYILLMLLPLHYKESHLWQQIAKWVFLIFNSIAIISNLSDSVYFQFTGRRTTATVFSEFSNEDNMMSVFANEFVHHWYLVLLGVVLIVLLWLCYRIPKSSYKLTTGIDYIKYYIINIVFLAVCVPLIIGGMRGGFTKAVRPITISNANQYVNKPSEAAVILNTPFSLIRTIGKDVFKMPEYYSHEQLERIYSPLHKGNATSLKKRNIVVLIVESFGREYIGAYNERLEGGKYKGYTPFVDKLYSQSMSFDYTFCNGRKSIDGMPSVLSSIPMFIEPFFLTPASMNDLSGIARELSNEGYSSAFFHGAQNGSMGFQAFAQATGFEEYYGRTEYNADSRFGGDNDFDGTWAIWDEPFLQFYALKMTEMKEPFVTAVFTASSHHPFAVPEKYKDIYPDEGDNVMHKCIRYVDHALEQFFETAKKQPWFNNTIFVFTSDHTNLSDHAEYQTDLGTFGSPILFYDPSGELFPAGRQHKVAQQIDIMPTVLSAIGYDRQYIAFGQDLLNTPDSLTWAINYNNGIYQYVENDRLLQFDGKQTVGFYDIHNDWLLKNNLVGIAPKEQHLLESKAKAIIQSYMERMNNNKLIYNGDE